MKWSWIGAGLALYVAVGCSSSEVPVPSDPVVGEGVAGSVRQPIQGGATDTSSTFAVGICGGAKGRCAGFCSGALIAPNLVVTARHCVDRSPEEVRCAENPRFSESMFSEMWITTAYSMFQSTDGWHRVQRVIRPPTDAVCGNDIALLVLSDLVGASEATPATPGVQYAMNDDRYTRKFVAVGFGSTSPTGGGSGTRRILQSISVLCVPGDKTIPCPADAGISESEFVGDEGTCEGDSGSSAFESNTFSKNAAVSFGVLSRGGLSKDGTRCGSSLYTRLDKFRDLVVAGAATASNNWSLYPKPSPDWTEYVPPTSADGGAKPTSKPSSGTLGMGAACVGSDECASGMCIEVDGRKLCSAACQDDAECAGGLTCSDGHCLPSDAPSASQTAGAAPSTANETGCTVSPARAPVGRFAYLGVALGLACLGRRAARRQRLDGDATNTRRGASSP